MPVGEGDRIHSRILQPFSQCVIVARHKEKTARALPKKTDLKKKSRKERRRGEAGNWGRQRRSSHPAAAREKEGTVLRRDFKAASRDVSPSPHLLNENFNNVSLLRRERCGQSRSWVMAGRGGGLQAESF